MLRLNRFKYLAPASLADARAMLLEFGSNAMLMAGGTDLLVNIKHRVATPAYVVSIRNLPGFAGITASDDGWLTVGAGTTLSTIERNAQLARDYPAVVHAARLISAPQIRSVATLGGNICLDTRCNYYNQSYEWRKAVGFCMKRDSPICRVAPGGDRCWAVSSADTVPVLIALQAEVSVVGQDGVRRVPVESLYADDGLVPMHLKFGEIVSAVHFPPGRGSVCVYQKFRIRQSFDFPLVGVAVSVRTGPSSVVQECRIVLTAVASLPERATAAENVLEGTILDEDSISAAGQAVYRLAKPMDNTAGTIFHRKRMARVLVERGLREIAGPDTPSKKTA